MIRSQSKLMTYLLRGSPAFGCHRLAPSCHALNCACACVYIVPQNESCALIQLTGSRYDIEEELVVRRPITIVGNPATLPYISAEESIRGFRVLVRKRDNGLLPC